MREAKIAGLWVAIAAALVCVAHCTPAEQQSASKAVQDAASCIKTQAEKPGATAEGVAIFCGLDLAPDLEALIAAFIDAAKAKKP